ncbi:deaminase/reductase [Nostoc linckia z18]|jgi:dihydrofolate reductase|uniref:Deaminase/reductase n=2 Tax=Nostoc linckia TaxID=92942 RepID=A0A9Q6EMT6_NOSLI|nr:dihydrofolate reductase family protein [Nostoc linckia]PHK38181.1 deaminase/reductase [Nostoc linckia z15]PHK39606.1 deaminase/reductase [Nostoc linckia z16]PHJ56893.1 deaminase/reductase [Nostoc linckia z3]PHJ59140.1 deaminase/reductase [Nostoc linckia z1]PHJ60325.1 deaminase/reductase [Nostoc linckia z2]
MKVTLYIATSLDGYIARSNGEIDWLSMFEAQEEDYGYAAFYQSIDAIVLGSKTYELGLSFDQWPYPDKKSFVFTQRHFKCDRNDVVFISDPVNYALSSIEAEGFKNIWLVGGGALINSFLKHSLIDEYIISIIPIILGDGVRLFPPPTPEEKLEMMNSKQYPSGLIQVHYRQKQNSDKFIIHNL